MLNMPIHKPHRQKNYCSSTGKSIGGETLKLEVLRANTQIHTASGETVNTEFWHIQRKKTKQNKTKLDSVVSGRQRKASCSKTNFLAWCFVLSKTLEVCLIIQKTTVIKSSVNHQISISQISTSTPVQRDE